MKNRRLNHAHEQAKIYRTYYQPSFNIFRLFKAVMSVFISGTSQAGGNLIRRK